MRRLFVTALCAVIAAPAAGWAQVPPAQDPPVQNSDDVAPAVLEPVAPEAPERALSDPGGRLVAPVTVEGKKDRKPLVTKRDVGGALAGVALGAAGAAFAGPFGKIAGGFLGKVLFKSLTGKKDKKAEPVQQAAAPSAQTAATSVAATAPAPSTDVPTAPPPPPAAVLVSETPALDPAEGPQVSAPGAPD